MTAAPDMPDAASQRWRVSELRGWQRALAAMSAGALSVLSFAPWHLPFVLFATLPVLVWLIDGARDPKDAAFAGWWYGFAFFLLNLFWIGEAFLVEAEKFAWMMPFAVTLLPIGMALFWAGAASICKRFWCAGYMRVLLFAAVMAAAEWVRGHVFTGLPWNVIGYALTYPVSWMQSAAFAGVYGLTLPAVLIFASPLVLLADAKKPSAAVALKSIAVGAVPLILLTLLGSWRLASADSIADVEGVKLRIVQPSVLQREKWMPSKQAEVFGLHLKLTVTAPDGTRDGAQGITHVIWPEAAMPFLPMEHPEALKAIGDVLPPGAFLISGAIRRDFDADNRQRGYNSILAFDTDGKVIASYDKVHLVPFGEYLPFHDVLSSLGLEKLTHGLGSFDIGPWPRPLLKVPGLPGAGGLICYEALFPGRIIDAEHRPGVLINVTNDGWFGDTSGPRQHFHQARVRAVEEGLPLVRAANNGISGLVDSFGRMRGFADMNTVAVVDAALPGALPITVYGRAGDGILAIMLLISAAVFGWSCLRSSKQ